MGFANARSERWVFHLRHFVWALGIGSVLLAAHWLEGYDYERRMFDFHTRERCPPLGVDRLLPRPLRTSVGRA